MPWSSYFFMSASPSVTVRKVQSLRLGASHSVRKEKEEEDIPGRQNCSDEGKEKRGRDSMVARY